MKLGLAAVAILVGVVVPSCAACGPPSVHVRLEAPAPVPDAGPVAESCLHACANIAAAYADAAGTCAAADLDRCSLGCRTDQAQGNAAELDVDCVLEAGPHRAALQACNVGCGP